MTIPLPQSALSECDALEALEQIERRILWLATRIIDHANRERPNKDSLKVGGHQASSASLVSVMTALWFHHLRANDRIAVKPHASPAQHAIEYLLGRLDKRYLTQLRSFGGLQAYPSRSKDPFVVDFSTGSVGHGAVAPLFAAAVRRYVEAHFGVQSRSRFVALVGDAELDEGNVWEAVAEPSVRGLGNVLWIIDFNRQSLDRVIPGVRIQQWRAMFEAHGWHTNEVKYGNRLRRFFDRTGGGALRGRLDSMSNEEYQSLYSCGDEEIVPRLVGQSADLNNLLGGMAPADVKTLVQDLGGHDIPTILAALKQCDDVTDRPSVIFAYTIKGYGLPFAGDPYNHSALLTVAQIDELRRESGLGLGSEWDRFEDGTVEAELCHLAANRLRRQEPPTFDVPSIPPEVEVATSRPVSTQATFGRLMTSLSRNEDLRPHIVTTAPDVATSTNLAGWINKVGVFAARDRPEWFSKDRVLRWSERETGQHVELGISEMNLMAMLGQLGLSRELHDVPLLPIGTIYDPFICRGLDALIYALYNDSRFIVVGTPSGVTLSSEGGAHQSTITPSIGIELPNLVYAEPAYSTALSWMFLAALERLNGPSGSATYLRLSTRSIVQDDFEELRSVVGDDRLRADVLAGGYVLQDADGSDAEELVNLVACGPVVTEVLTAATELAQEGVAARIIDVTSPDELYRDWRRKLRRGIRGAFRPNEAPQLRRLFPPSTRHAPMVTVHDAASHALAWIGSAVGASVVPLGVDVFGQSGAIPDLYNEYDLSAGSVVNAALMALASNRN